MRWVKIKNKLPEKDGLYRVKRRWNKNIMCFSTEDFKDGKFNHDHDKDLGEIEWWAEKTK